MINITEEYYLLFNSLKAGIRIINGNGDWTIPIQNLASLYPNASSLKNPNTA